MPHLKESIFKKSKIESCIFVNSEFFNSDFTDLLCLKDSVFRILLIKIQKIVSFFVSNLPLLFNKSSKKKLDEGIYIKSSKFKYIRMEKCYGSQSFQNYAMDQACLEELQDSDSLWNRVTYRLWFWSSDCGRSVSLWGLWSLAIALIFGAVYANYPVWSWLPDSIQSFFIHLAPKMAVNVQPKFLFPLLFQYSHFYDPWFWRYYSKKLDRRDLGYC